MHWPVESDFKQFKSLKMRTHDFSWARHDATQGVSHVTGKIQNERSAVNSDCKSCRPMINASAVLAQMKAGKTFVFPAFQPAKAGSMQDIIQSHKLPPRQY